jgi:hypothetical protein
MKHAIGIAVPLIVLVGVAYAQAQSSYPMLMDLNPIAAQVGTTSEHEVSARYNLFGAYQILVTGAGVEGEVIQPEKKADDKKPADTDKKKDEKTDGKKKDEKPAKPETPKIKVRFKVAADALPGVRDFRIATPQGVSTIGQLVIVRDPVVKETAKNDTLADATPITLPATVCGVIEKAEDVDQFKFHVEAGTALSFHVRSARCQDRIHDLQTHIDPIIAIKNASGTVLALNDNYFFADPFLAHKFEAAGDYYLEIRDVRYQGNQYWQYSVEINSRPFVTNVYPLAVTPERPTKLELVGYNLPADPTTTLTLKGNTPEGLQWAMLPIGKDGANAAPIIVTKSPAILETADHSTTEKAQEMTIPAGVNGRISKPGEVDYYVFQAKKGERFTFEVVARRHQSALDPLLAIVNEKGARVIENDDMRPCRHTYADSLIEDWAAPADGRYFVEVRDLHLQGGPDFVYYLKGLASQPNFALELDTDKTLLTPGTGGAIYVRIYRRAGFNGEVQLAIDGLLKGVTAQCGKILAGGIDGVIVLHAAKDAPQGIANVRISGKGSMTVDGKTTEYSAIASPLQEIYSPGGGRSQWPVEMPHTVSVSDAMDIRSVNLSETNITLKPGESKKIEVTIERSPGFDKNVTLDVMFRHLAAPYGNSLPAGVTFNEKQSKSLLTGTQTQGFITFTAAPDCKPVERQEVPVMAHVAINFVMKMSYTAEPVFITVLSK